MKIQAALPSVPKTPANLSAPRPSEPKGTPSDPRESVSLSGPGQASTLEVVRGFATGAAMFGIPALVGMAAGPLGVLGMGVTYAVGGFALSANSGPNYKPSLDVWAGLAAGAVGSSLALIGHEYGGVATGLIATGGALWGAVMAKA